MKGDLVTLTRQTHVN